MFAFFKAVWEKNWKGKATLIAGALILIGAVVGVTYGVVTRAGDEGLMKTETGVLHWEKSGFPIQCICAESVSGEHAALLDKARRELNTKVGVQLFSPCMPWMVPDKDFPATPLPGHVLVQIGTSPEQEKDGTTMETPWDPHPGGTTLLVRKKENTDVIYGSMVWVDPVWAKEYAVWLHELGHVLGLGHDRVKDSVMWPTIQERPGSLSNKDVKCLQTAYK